MKPDVPLVLEDHARRLVDRFAPKLTGFDANGAAMMAAMLTMVAEEWDRAAARRVEENVAIRAIFHQALAHIDDEALTARLDELVNGRDEDLHINVLETANQALRAALGDLHAHIEGLDSLGVRGVEAAIWEELRQSVGRRRSNLANF